MIASRRTLAPILWIGLGALLLLVRQAQVQIAEHDVWSEEAARLERSGEVIPYRRGSIEDANGRVLVRDVEAYHLNFDYREFRRGHPLAMVAHAASVLLLEPVPLTLALDFAPDWALAFVELTPGQLRDLGAGVGLRVGPLEGLPATGSLLGVAADDEERGRLDLGRRSGDIGFYIGRLLELSSDEVKALLRASEDTDRVDVPFVELVAKLRRMPADELRRAMRAHVAKSLDDLDLLALRMRFGVALPGAGEPLESEVPRPAAALAAELETWRRGIENAAASRLFREATGFVPGRLEPGTLLEYFELDWISVYLRWSPERLAQWAVQARHDFLVGWRDGVVLPRLMTVLRSGPPPTASEVARVLSSLWYTGDTRAAVLDGERLAFDDRTGLAVASRLDSVFLADMGPELGIADARLPWVQLAEREPESVEAFRSTGVELEAAWAAVWPRGASTRAHTRVEVALREALESDHPTSRAARWDFHFQTPDIRSRVLLGDLAAELADAWEAAWQAVIASVLEEARAGAAPDELDAAGALLLDPIALDRAADRARFVLRDFGMRRNLLDECPDYEVVQLLTRFPEHFPGFGAEDARERLELFTPEDGALPAGLLVGHTALLDAELAQAQRIDARRLAELRQLGRRSPEEEAELVELVARVLTYHEERGISGIEGSWNDYLRGTNGYRERVGLEEAEGRRGHRVSLREVENGRDLRLTLDLGLGRVAEEVLERPIVPSRVTRRDPDWLADPEGAIVIVRMNGDVVVAASGPAPWSPRVSPERPAVERCFRKPDFQPPGSIFKPFSAMEALELGKLLPDESFVCLAEAEDVGSNYGVYKGVHCHKPWGHSTEFDRIELARALCVSCNVYFAHVGERLDQAELWTMAHNFGFGEPTGVLRADGPPGLVEHVNKDLFTGSLSASERMRAANGLSVVEATPAQLARAAIGLATGVLPELRLVDAARPREGGAFEALPRAAPRALPYSEENFALVRGGMAGVAGLREGSAYTALSKSEVGIELFLKTGSADLAETRASGRMVKHTWVMGWTNDSSGRPAVAMIFFVRKTVTTSSYSAVWLARQFLLRPEVRAFLRSEGVPVADVTTEVGR